MRDGTRARILEGTLALAIAVAAALVFSASALAGTMVISSPSPTPGSTVTYSSPTVGVWVDGTATIPLTQTFYIDGIPRTTWGDYRETGGHWEDDGCETYWVPDSWDYTDAYLYAFGSGLVDGAHTARATVVDSEGSTAEQSWSFNVNQSPSIGSYSPSQITTDTTPVIRIPFTDNGGTHTCTLTLNGAAIPTTQVGSTFEGAVTTPLTDGSVVSAVATVRDQAGNTSTRTWSFRVFSENMITAVMSPAPGSNLTSSPGLNCNVYHLGIVQSIIFKLDDRAPVAGSMYKPDATHWAANYYPGTLSDGSHVATATVTDSLGVKKSFTTSFNVNIPPSIGSVSPANGARVETKTPQISAYVYDNSGVLPFVEMKLNGVVVPHTYTAGWVRYTPTAELEPDVLNTAVVTVRDAAGNERSLTWSFRVERFARMPMNTCTSCHTTYPATHEAGSCEGCHGPAPHGDYNCQDCHSDPYHDLAACEGCHYTQTQYSHETFEGSPHLTTTAFTECQRCHSDSLTREHARHKNASGSTLDCLACHGASAPAAVKAAIATNDTRCEACHPNADHTAVHVSPTTSSCFGSGCHPASKNLADVHAAYAGPGKEFSQYANECDLCHQNPSVNTDTAGTGCTGACHDLTTHSDYAVSHTPSAASSECTECHAGEISSVHGALADSSKCAICHSSPSNWTKSADCSSCHADVSHEALHGSTTSAGCPSCHATNLIGEHVTERGLTCSTCHDSTDPTVTTAIAQHSDDCVSCHGDDTHAGVSHATNVTCAESCHAVADLVLVHGRDCSKCHPGAPIDGSWDRTCSAEGCHPARHAELSFDHAYHGTARDGDDCWECHDTPTAQWDCRVCHVLPDTTAPSTTSNARESYAGGASITLSASDPGSGSSGIARVCYRLDGGPITVGTTVSVAAPSSGSAVHRLEYWSVDKALNAEQTHEAIFEVWPAETTAPATTSDAKASYTGSATIKLTATDQGGSGVAATYYRVDGKPQQSGSQVVVSSSGNHSLEFWSVDHSGNIEEHKWATFSIGTGTGTIYFMWDSPPSGSTASVTVWNSSYQLVYQAASPAWSPPGCFAVAVPVSSKPYYLQAGWYDAENDEEGVSSTTALITAPGKTAYFWY